MYAKILLMAAVLFSGQAFAQGMPSGAEVFNYTKEHFSASYHGEYYFTRRDVESANPDDHDIQDLKIMHNPTINYKMTKNWIFTATAEFKYTDAPRAQAGTYVNDYHRALFTLTRKNILTEKEKGIQLDAGIGRRDYNTRTTPSVYGNDRLFVNLTKNYGKNSGSLFIQYLYNDPRQFSASTWKHGIELIPTINLQLTEKLSYLFNDDINLNTPHDKSNPRGSSITHEMNLAYLNYQWTDKINTYYQFKYYHTEGFTNEQNSKDDYIENYVGLGYAFTPKLTLTGEVGTEIFHAHDGRSFFAKKASYPEIAIYLDASI